MRIRDMFAKDIDRDINGVVKVAQEEDAAIEQELDEYVVTRELRRRFADFFESYEAALDRPTDKVGVWISGFFGSGKSHFLKMLSYLLTNREVGGRPAIEHFVGPATGESKFADPMLEAKVRRCVEVPTESILFNIDNKGPVEKDRTAILRVFARVFYEHLGYYGEDLRLARLERYVDERGRGEAFRQAFERINGGSWLEERETYDFVSDDVIGALAEAGVMSEAEAERWFEGSDAVELSIDGLTTEICDYAARRAEECGGQFRLLFCVDEVGQYIGSDGELMLNLQTIVEELGTKGAGRVWVLVTSQEAIDEVTRVAGLDFSKIQGRFDTRLSLSSSSVDEVIKRRVLDKTDAARDALRLDYEERQAALRNLFHFEESRKDLVGWSGEEDFVESYPFVGYQFKVVQDVFTEVRKHGSSGKHLSSGERSMLSGFQEAAQRVADEQQGALVPFPLFYDTIHTFLEGVVRRVIERCERAAAERQGVEPQDVDMLKCLFLIRYIDDIKASVGNLAILLADRADADVVALREGVQASLERLVRENYVARSGDTYAFLTDEEQDIARAISQMRPDAAQITQKIANVVFDDVLPERKLRQGANDFPVDRYVDETPYGAAQGGLRLRVVTALSDLSSASHQELALRSAAGEAVCVLRGDAYYDALEEAARIQRYAQTQNVAALPATTQAIIEGRVREQRSLETEARGLLERAIAEADFYVAGEAFRPKGSGARRRVEEALSQLVGSVYPKLGYVDGPVADDAQVLAIARGQQGRLEGMEPNARATADVAAWLDSQRMRNLATTMRDVQERYAQPPYGWRDLDVAGVVAQLVASQQVTLRRSGTVLRPEDPGFAELLRQRSKTAGVQVERRVSVSPEQRAQAQRILREAFAGLAAAEDVPLDEDGLMAAGERVLAEARDVLGAVHTRYYANAAVRYPGRDAVRGALGLYEELADKVREPAAFVRAVREAEDELYDFSEELDDVMAFFKGGQKAQFERAWQLARKMDTAERSYFAGDDEVERALAEIDDIVESDVPYRRIKDLPELMEVVERSHEGLLEEKRERTLGLVDEVFRGLREAVAERGVTLPGVGEQRETFESQARAAERLAVLDAIEPRVDSYRTKSYLEIERIVAERERPKPEQASDRPVVSHAPARARAPRPVRVRLGNVCDPETLRTEADVDAYLARLREGLLERLDGADDGIFVS